MAYFRKSEKNWGHLVSSWKEEKLRLQSCWDKVSMSNLTWIILMFHYKNNFRWKSVCVERDTDDCNDCNDVKTCRVRRILYDMDCPKLECSEKPIPTTTMQPEPNAGMSDETIVEIVFSIFGVFALIIGSGYAIFKCRYRGVEYRMSAHRYWLFFTFSSHYFKITIHRSTDSERYPLLSIENRNYHFELVDLISWYCYIYHVYFGRCLSWYWMLTKKYPNILL